MLAIVLTMLVVLVISAVVVAYVAYPHRGEPLPRLAWLGEAVRRGVEALPTIDGADHHEHRAHHEHREGVRR